jgi:hypothetical protein
MSEKRTYLKSVSDGRYLSRVMNVGKQHKELAKELHLP